MNKYKVCVSAICKNEAKFVKKWYDSMKEADLIVVADTGSTDQTIELLKECKIEVHSITVDPWRFDTARNLSMDFIPPDYDICVCTDLDEVFDPDWREELERNWMPYNTLFRYTYTYGFYNNGKPIVTFLYEKIHQRHNFRWVYPVHEVLEYSGTKPDIYGLAEKMHLKHYPDQSKSRGNYLKLLELSAKDFPLYDRNIFYLGREYMYHNMFVNCIETLTYHLTIPTANWPVERCASMRYIANSYLNL